MTGYNGDANSTRSAGSTKAGCGPRKDRSMSRPSGATQQCGRRIPGYAVARNAAPAAATHSPANRSRRTLSMRPTVQPPAMSAAVASRKPTA